MFNEGLPRLFKLFKLVPGKAEGTIVMEGMELGAENMACDDNEFTFMELKKEKPLAEMGLVPSPLVAQLLYEYPEYMSS